MNRFSMSIDGAQEPGRASFAVVNPATEEPLADAPSCQPDQLEAAIAGARRAFTAWRRDEAARRAALERAGELLAKQADAIGRTLTLEQGKPLVQARAEVAGAATQLRAMAKLPFPHEVTRDDAGGRIEIAYRPFGVVAAITPWNFPVMIAMTKIAPALLAGNTMVLKPSPFTPLSTLQMGTVLAEALPPGVLNIVSGDGVLGGLLTGHPDVRKISFTGSVSTGIKVAHAAAADLKRVTLELGGNDAAIVLDDVAIESIATQLFWSAFMNCGQICIAIKRLYVPRALCDRLIDALVVQARSAKVGDGLDPDTQIGPINNAMQLDRVCELVEDARVRGATLHTGGRRLERKGYFFEPTIVSGLDEGARLVAEEQFGPVLPVLPYDTIEEAIERANATPYGLGASVWAADAARAREVAAVLDAGTIWINQHLVLSPLAPFAGAKTSGIGEAGGRWGLESYLQKHVINERKR